MDILTRLLIVALAVYGAANAITVLKAGHPIRSLLEAMELRSKNRLIKGFWSFWKILFKCPPCLSFWIGMATSVWVLSITKGMVAEWWMSMLLDGFIVCGTSWLIHLAAERMGHGLDV
jgi:hypothetical protein